VIDLPEKTRHAVQMTAAARALACAAPNDHRRRVLGRYVFVYLHDVVRFTPEWRNALLADPRTKATAQAAEPALRRLRHDWESYANVRHYLAAKRQPRVLGDKAADQLAAFRLWADIGDLSVESLTDDAIELYAQLAAFDSLPAVDPEPAVPDVVREVLAELDPIGEESFLEATASSFGSAKRNALPIRMGGETGALIALINDVADSAATLSALILAVGDAEPFRRLLTCQLPSEINELLRLTIGPPTSAQPAAGSLLALYGQPKRASEPLQALEGLRDSIEERTLNMRLDWRNRLGAHIDANCPWDLLKEGIEDLNLDDLVRLLDHIRLQLELAACTPGGPVLLLMDGRHFKSLLATAGYENGLSYKEDGPGCDVGQLVSALPPPEVDAEFVIWTGGPSGSLHSAAVAGMIAGRNREVRERLGFADSGPSRRRG
jgi:hypothetical protein